MPRRTPAEKAVSASQAQRHSRTLLGLFEVAAVTRPVLMDALTLGFGDYEDAVLHEAARHAGLRQLSPAIPAGSRKRSYARTHPTNFSGYSALPRKLEMGSPLSDEMQNRSCHTHLRGSRSSHSSPGSPGSAPLWLQRFPSPSRGCPGGLSGAARLFSRLYIPKYRI